MFNKIKEIRRLFKNKLIKINLHMINALDFSTEFDGTISSIRKCLKVVDRIQDEYENATGMRISREIIVADGGALIDGNKKSLYLISDKALYNLDSDDDDLNSQSWCLYNQVIGAFDSYNVRLYSFYHQELDGYFVVYQIPVLVIEYAYAHIPYGYVNRMKKLQKYFSKLCITVLIRHYVDNLHNLSMAEYKDDKNCIEVCSNKIEMFKQFDSKCFIIAGFHTMTMSSKAYRSVLRNLSFMPWLNISFIDFNRNYKGLSLYMCSIGKKLEGYLGKDRLLKVQKVYSSYDTIYKIIANNEGQITLPAEICYQGFYKSLPYFPSLYIVDYDWALEHAEGIVTALNNYIRESLNFSVDELEKQRSKDDGRPAIFKLSEYARNVIESAMTLRENDDRLNPAIKSVISSGSIILPSGKKYGISLPMGYSGSLKECLKDTLIKLLKVDSKIINDKHWFIKHSNCTAYGQVSTCKYVIFIDGIYCVYADNTPKTFSPIYRANEFDINEFKALLKALDIDELPSYWDDIEFNDYRETIYQPKVSDVKIVMMALDPVSFSELDVNTLDKNAIYLDPDLKKFLFYSLNDNSWATSIPFTSYEDLNSRQFNRLDVVIETEKAFLTGGDIYKDKLVIRLSDNCTLMGYINNTKYNFTTENIFDIIDYVTKPFIEGFRDITHSTKTVFIPIVLEEDGTTWRMLKLN